MNTTTKTDITTKALKEKTARLVHLQQQIEALEKEAKPIADELKALAIAHGEPFGKNGLRITVNLGMTEAQIPVVSQTRKTLQPGAVDYARLNCPEVITDSVDVEKAMALTEHVGKLVKVTTSWSLKAIVVNDYHGKPNN